MRYCLLPSIPQARANSNLISISEGTSRVYIRQGGIRKGVLISAKLGFKQFLFAYAGPLLLFCLKRCLCSCLRLTGDSLTAGGRYRDPLDFFSDHWAI